MDDEEIRVLVARLSRSHKSGGKVVERAAITAAGVDSAAVLAWIGRHDGVPEEQAVTSAGGGLHGMRSGGGSSSSSSTRAPLRYVLPAEALSS